MASLYPIVRDLNPGSTGRGSHLIVLLVGPVRGLDFILAHPQSVLAPVDRTLAVPILFATLPPRL
jgi:hypothetical protein